MALKLTPVGSDRREANNLTTLKNMMGCVRAACHSFYHTKYVW